ncbi:MAG: sel1 repeat family protein, partial [Bacteroidaceae bacterium]|nr:sel1 repeat family protein [Bacteroidaceae bacterium]
MKSTTNKINFIMPTLILCLAVALLSACSHRVTRADAFYEKGMNYKEGKGVERSSLKSEKYLQRSVALYKKAALRGNAEAQYKLAECYNKGIGVSSLPYEAVKWYTEAANQGHAEAQY